MNAMIEDWDDAYANGAYIADAGNYPARWAQAAARFRDAMAARQQAECDIAYGAGERQRLDLFRPQGDIRGLAVFVHGGYWRAFDKSAWSHLASGPTSRGWAVAMPSYDLAPTVSIGEITRQIGNAVSQAATLVEGPIRLAGHSAGGHLVTRMMCVDSPLAADVRQRIERVVSISGLHDLRPLLKTAMNDDFRMDATQAVDESPALKQPLAGVELVCWVGADERPEFIRQSELLANVWTGFGIDTSVHLAAAQHHFNVIDGLADPQSPLSRALLE
jgi:acetyl esterase/lipase